MRALVFFTIFLVMIACTSREEKAAEHLKNGIELLYATENKKALAEFDACLKLDPGNQEAYFYKGNACFNLGRAELAIENYNRAIGLDSNYANAWFNRGNVWFYLNDREQACIDWRMAEKLGKPNVSDKTRNCP